jgi:hypothetical protein
MLVGARVPAFDAHAPSSPSLIQVTNDPWTPSNTREAVMLNNCHYASCKRLVLFMILSLRLLGTFVLDVT